MANGTDDQVGFLLPQSKQTLGAQGQLTSVSHPEGTLADLVCGLRLQFLEDLQGLSFARKSHIHVAR